MAQRAKLQFSPSGHLSQAKAIQQAVYASVIPEWKESPDFTVQYTEGAEG